MKKLFIKLNDKIERIYEKINIKHVIIALLLFAFFTWLIDYSPIGVSGLLKVTNGANILDFECNYTANEAYQMLEALGESGRSFHLTKIMPCDIFFPMSLMLFLFTTSTLVLKNITKKTNILRYFPILAIVNMLLDWTENIGITTMLLSYPTKLSLVARLTGIVSLVKMCCVATLFVSIALFIIILIIKCIIKFINNIKNK